MTAKITRKRALERAQSSLQADLKEAYSKMKKYEADAQEDPARREWEAEYAELTAALQVIENLARQKEMHL